MRIVLREKNKLQEIESTEKGLEFKTRVSPKVFLDLTPPEATIKARAERVVGKFDPAKAGTIYLGIDPQTGEVIEHGGRARSQAAINSGLEKIDVSIKLKLGSPPISWDELPEKFHQQDGGANSVNKNMFTYIGMPKADKLMYKQAIVSDTGLKPLTILHSRETLKRLYSGRKLPSNYRIIYADNNQPIPQEELENIFK